MDAALFREPRRRMIPLTDGEMAALEFGDAGRPLDVVFLHANGFNALTYRAVLGPLGLGLRVLAPDLRGHGDSRLPAEPRGRRSWRDLRDDVLCLLERTADGPVVLAGHSMGATVALLAAAERPDRVRALALFDPVVLSRRLTLTARAPWLFAGLWRRSGVARAAARRRPAFDSAAGAFKAYRGRGAFRTWPEIMLADYVAGGLRARADGEVALACTPAWEASNFSAMGNDPRAALQRLQRPVAVFQAERGSTCRLTPGSRPVRLNPRVRLTTVADTSHFLPMERPDVVRDAILDAVEA